MDESTKKAPIGPVLTDATVFVMNRGLDPEGGQGMLAVSPRGCFYFEGGSNICRTISLDELEKFFSARPRGTEEEQRIVDLVMSTIISCKNGNRPA